MKKQHPNIAEDLFTRNVMVHKENTKHDRMLQILGSINSHRRMKRNKRKRR